ncbi:hypothetical protein D8674_003459 [Pyrus ussuriensis x Pyrus communis]|uniref:Uncharacterized protein n=1 Tax=Pyrus ussuriensis x Pyrus communis TaxID=2448454 RepID=A0A5N5FW10_9ROSA|nr:hypothetical protein D8674_003459 [Pyrus ussuriensis x Pyrus communis]
MESNIANGSVRVKDGNVIFAAVGVTLVVSGFGGYMLPFLVDAISVIELLFQISKCLNDHQKLNLNTEDVGFDFTFVFIRRTVSKGPWNILHFWISLCSLASHSSSGEIKTGIRCYSRPAAFIIESEITVPAWMIMYDTRWVGSWDVKRPFELTKT